MLAHNMPIKTRASILTIFKNKNVFCNVRNFSKLIVNLKIWKSSIIKTQYTSIFKTNLQCSFHFKKCKPVNKKQKQAHIFLILVFECITFKYVER